MADHDACCPVRGLPAGTCAYCRAITRARSDERTTFDQTWKTNLPALEARHAKDERMAVEKRVRESGVARWLPSHAWDTLIAAVRGSQ